jgi:hypothetical protein
MAAGMLTMEVARKLRQASDLQGYEILCGHGQVGIDPAEYLGKLKAWYGVRYANHTILADLDIAIVQRNTNQIVALIEIEETTSKPKVLLGDALATLLSSRITFQGKRHWQVGPWTTLIVLAKCSTEAHKPRISFLQEQVTQLKMQMATPNAAMGRVVMAGFLHAAELEAMLYTEIQAAIMNAGQTCAGVSS